MLGGRGALCEMVLVLMMLGEWMREGWLREFVCGERGTDGKYFLVGGGCYGWADSIQQSAPLPTTFIFV